MSKDKVVRNLYGSLLEETSRRCHPFTALIELTYACNINCEHCYLINRTREGELTTEEICSILEQLAEEGVLFLTFSGGEPLLRRDFFEIAHEARRLGFALRIFTNGTLVDKKTSCRIAKLDPLEVEVSFYGSKAGTHDKLTGISGSFHRTMSGIKNLLREGVRVNIKAPLTKHNYMEYVKMRALAERLGVHFFYDTQIVPKDDGDPCPVALNMDERGLKVFYGHTKEWNGQDASWLMEKGRPYCNSGRNTLVISPYGDVYPCVQIRWKAGNLREESFAEIWRYSPVLMKMRRLNLKDFEECIACDLFAYCFHCPGVSLLETGHLLGCSPLAKSQALVLSSTHGAPI